ALPAAPNEISEPSSACRSGQLLMARSDGTAQRRHPLRPARSLGLIGAPVRRRQPRRSDVVCIAEHIGAPLRERCADITCQPLPERWVDLIDHLKCPGAGASGAVSEAPPLVALAPLVQRAGAELEDIQGWSRYSMAKPKL